MLRRTLLRPLFFFFLRPISTYGPKLVLPYNAPFLAILLSIRRFPAWLGLTILSLRFLMSMCCGGSECLITASTRGAASAFLIGCRRPLLRCGATRAILSSLGRRLLRPMRRPSQRLSDPPLRRKIDARACEFWGMVVRRP